jgi:hypothetical protein
MYICMYIFIQFHRFSFKERPSKGRIPACAFVKLKQTLITPCLDIENQNLHLTERGNCYSRNFCPPPPLPLTLAIGLGTFPIYLNFVQIQHIPAAVQAKQEQTSWETRWPLRSKALRSIFCIRFDIFTEVCFQITIFWFLTSCRLIEGYRHFGETCCRHSFNTFLQNWIFPYQDAWCRDAQY